MTTAALIKVIVVAMLKAFHDICNPFSPIVRDHTDSNIWSPHTHLFSTVFHFRRKAEFKPRFSVSHKTHVLCESGKQKLQNLNKRNEISLSSLELFWPRLVLLVLMWPSYNQGFLPCRLRWWNLTLGKISSLSLKPNGYGQKCFLMGRKNILVTQSIIFALHQ